MPHANQDTRTLPTASHCWQGPRVPPSTLQHELNLDPNTLAVAEAYSSFRLGNGTCWDHSQLGGTTPRGSGRYTTASMFQNQNVYSFGEDRS